MQDGRVFAWGLGGSGANGNGYSSGASAINWYAKPVLTAANTPLTGVVDVVRKYSGGYALLQDGSAYAWGWGVNGMNGNGSLSDNLYAQPIMTSASTQLSGVKQLFEIGVPNGLKHQAAGRVTLEEEHLAQLGIDEGNAAVFIQEEHTLVHVGENATHPVPLFLKCRERP